MTLLAAIELQCIVNGAVTPFPTIGDGAYRKHVRGGPSHRQHVQKVCDILSDRPTHRQTHRQTYSSQYFATALAGEVINIICWRQYSEIKKIALTTLSLNNVVKLLFLQSLNCYSFFSSLYAVARPSVCPSVVCKTRTLYLAAVWNFCQRFYTIWYLGHPLTSTENCTEIIPGEPLRREALNARGVAKYSDFWPLEGYILETVQDRR